MLMLVSLTTYAWSFLTTDDYTCPTTWGHAY